MARQRPALLQTQQDDTERPYEIRLRMQEGRTAVFSYSDKHMAREHYDTLRAHGVLGGYAIRTTEFHDTTKA